MKLYCLHKNAVINTTILPTNRSLNIDWKKNYKNSAQAIPPSCHATKEMPRQSEHNAKQLFRQFSSTYFFLNRQFPTTNTFKCLLKVHTIYSQSWPQCCHLQHSPTVNATAIIIMIVTITIITTLSIMYQYQINWFWYIYISNAHITEFLMQWL